MRTAEDINDMVDNTRLKFEVCVDTAGRKQLLEVGEQMFPDEMVNAAKMFNGFKFKAKANSKDQAGGLNQNFQQMLEVMQQFD